MTTIRQLYLLTALALIVSIHARSYADPKYHEISQLESPNGIDNKLVSKRYNFTETNPKSNSNDLQAPPPAPTVELFQKQNDKDKKRKLVLSCILALSAAIIVVVIVVVAVRWKRDPSYTKMFDPLRNEAYEARVICGTVFSVLFKLAVNMIKGKMDEHGTTIFSQQIKVEELAFLEKEDGVASLQIIGKGGCGEVYKTDLPEGKVKTIAIKKIDHLSKDAAELTEQDTKDLNKKMRQIKSEIQTVGEIRHRNLLPLLAHVSRPNCHYLVYEFMKNGSLQDILQQVKEGRRELNWLARYKVAIGVVTGLEYLHMSHTPRIVHRDLKPANVLLDDYMEARIADFGLAKSIPDADTHMTSSNVAGTLGYIAPEYHQTLKFTDKCDIYSFGVVLASLVMGKFPSDEFFQRSEFSLLKWMRNVMTGEDPKQAIDPKMLGNGFEEQMLLVLKVACFCTLDNPRERPNSKDCRMMLAQIEH